MFSRRNKSEPSNREVRRRKWWLPPLIGLVVLIILGVVGRQLYHRLAPARLAKRAHELVEKEDFRGAALMLNQAIHINPESDPATRAMADLMERLQMPTALDWRRRVAEMNPGSLPDALSWARLALRNEQPLVAKQALDSVPSEKRGNADWQSAAGLAAIRTGQWQTARDHFAEAARLQPGEQVHKYNLALVQLQAQDKEERAKGMENLTKLADEGKVSVFARRTAVTEFMRAGKFEEALAQSAKLTEFPGALISDRTTYIDLLRKLNRPEAAAALEKTSALARERAADAGPMINWFRLRGDALGGLTWAEKLDPTTAKDSTVAAAKAECLLELGRWSELQAATAGMDWKANNPRRMALLARAQHGLGDRQAAQGSWATAVRLAGTDRGQLSRLAAAASQWGWKLEMRDALWAAVEGASPKWALHMLHESYINDGDTAGILRVARRQAAIDPADRKARNNAIVCTLLLGTELKQSLEQAQQLLKEAPADPVIISTYGFALLANGMPEEALEAIEKVPAQQLRKPEMALYYALALRANGEEARAREFAQLARQARLLPEEKALLEGIPAATGATAQN